MTGSTDTSKNSQTRAGSTNYRPNPRALAAAAKWKADREAEAAEAARIQQELEAQLEELRYKALMVLLAGSQKFKVRRVVN